MRHVTLPLATVRLLREVCMRRATTQPELQTALGMSAPTIFRSVKQLRDLGILVEGEQITSENRGRPAVSLRPKPQGLAVFSLVIRSDESRLHLVDAYGEIQDSTLLPISGQERYEHAVESYARAISEMTETARSRFAITAGIGVSFAGSVDPESGCLTKPSRFPGWRGQPLAQDLSARTSLPCSLDNDATGLARAALWFSSPQLPQSFALLYIDFGLGASFCFNRQVYTGQKRVPSGLGHTAFSGWSELLCRCGRIGCLETVLSIPGVLNQAADQGITIEKPNGSLSSVPLQALEDQAQHGALAAARLLQLAGERAAIVGVTLAQWLDLPLVIYAGRLLHLSQIARAALNRELTRQSEQAGRALGWQPLENLLPNRHPEALGATAIALDALYRTRVLVVLNEHHSYFDNRA